MTVHAAHDVAALSTEGYVINGPITLLLGDDRLSLASGDAVLIPRKTPHRWQNEGTVTAEALLVSVRLSQ